MLSLLGSCRSRPSELLGSDCLWSDCQALLTPDTGCPCIPQWLGPVGRNLLCCLALAALSIHYGAQSRTRSRIFELWRMHLQMQVSLLNQHRTTSAAQSATRQIWPSQLTNQWCSEPCAPCYALAAPRRRTPSCFSPWKDKSQSRSHLWEIPSLSFSVFCSNIFS